MAAKPRSDVDWEKVEAEFRAGILSVRQIAAQHKISHTAVNERAREFGWDRDLAAKIKAKADAKVSRRMVSTMVSKSRLATEQEIIEAGAERIAQIKMNHRGGSAKLFSLGFSLLEELAQQSSDPAALEQLGEMMRSPDAYGNDRLNDLYRKVISTPGRIDSFKKATEAIRIAIGLEREAYGLETGDAADKPMHITIEQRTMRASELPLAERLAMRQTLAKLGFGDQVVDARPADPRGT
jgi:hypothetical protein